MKPSIKNALKPETNWQGWQKVLFRYCFVALSLLSLVAYNPIIMALDISWANQNAFFAHLQGLAGSL